MTVFPFYVAHYSASSFYGGGSHQLWKDSSNGALPGQENTLKFYVST